jgi:hypothetical protein
MNIVEPQLSAATSERDRMEAQVWSRTMAGMAFPGDRAPYIDALAELMTGSERAKWRAICIAIEELEKHLP